MLQSERRGFRDTSRQHVWRLFWILLYKERCKKHPERGPQQCSRYLCYCNLLSGGPWCGDMGELFSLSLYFSVKPFFPLKINSSAGLISGSSGIFPVICENKRNSVYIKPGNNVKITQMLIRRIRISVLATIVKTMFFSTFTTGLLSESLHHDITGSYSTTCTQSFYSRSENFYDSELLWAGMLQWYCRTGL